MLHGGVGGKFALIDSRFRPAGRTRFGDSARGRIREWF